MIMSNRLVFVVLVVLLFLQLVSSNSITLSTTNTKDKAQPSSSSSSSSLSLPVSSLSAPIEPNFTRNEVKEHNHVWNIMQKSCFGRWSGSMQTFDVEYDSKKTENKLVLSDGNDSKRLNFRLWARKTKQHRRGLLWPLWSSNNSNNSFGTWTVWNLQKLGDEVNVPLRRLPSMAKPSQLKIGFHPGCVLRFPGAYKEVPRVVFELGYWDRYGDGMRRTVVVDYHSTTHKKKMDLKDITIVQQKAISGRGAFVGNTTIPEDINILPDHQAVSTNDVKDTFIGLNRGGETMEPMRIERVELQSMTRIVTKKRKITGEEKKKALQVLRSLRPDADGDGDSSYSMALTLPNGLRTRLPKQLVLPTTSNTKTISFVFAHAWSGARPLQALCLEYDPTTSKAIAATMYSYNQ